MRLAFSARQPPQHVAATRSPAARPHVVQPLPSPVPIPLAYVTHAGGDLDTQVLARRLLRARSAAALREAAPHTWACAPSSSRILHHMRAFISSIVSLSSPASAISSTMSQPPSSSPLTYT